jgi:hypothetical protein
VCDECRTGWAGNELVAERRYYFFEWYQIWYHYASKRTSGIDRALAFGQDWPGQGLTSVKVPPATETPLPLPVTSKAPEADMVMPSPPNR